MVCACVYAGFERWNSRVGGEFACSQSRYIVFTYINVVNV